MAEGAEQSANVWPMPKFHFMVKWNDVQMSFQEVSGLDAQSEEIKYRSGDSAIFSPVKMPGQSFLLSRCLALSSTAMSR